MTKRFDETTALHEAGHAVAAIVLGRRLKAVHVCECGRGYVDYSPMKIGEVDETVIRLAGATAVAYKLGSLPTNHGLSDSDRLGLSDLSEAEMKLATERTAQIVLSNWQEIQNLATALAVGGTISALDGEDDQPSPEPKSGLENEHPFA